ncbi:DUF1707 and DUF4190 domain-containing protein [Streptomyces sp. HD]|uniref:DUF1707 and DUF4190 domain-containing protein n=1 Tax=Streptomyces sp. HD TaxID=3020892 RepID=UPI00232BEA8D|nr:DUF1707 and DUF4190 domain-containing protein [Streptomyces sp. HD]MDC0765716.1 DUF1707 and DUF4190 domain-containing protein [Streptomyces sp. HD]
MAQPSWQPWQPWQGSGPPQPWQGGDVPQPWSGPGAPAMLASHADRERAVDVLRAGFGEGRLEQPEFEKRVARAYAARTVGELALLVADLPQGPVPQPAPVTPVPRTFLPVSRPQTNGKAVGSAVCGVLCLVSFGLTGIPAVVLGHAARSEIRRTGEGGDALAMTGLVLGWLSTAAWAVLLTLMVVAAAVSGSGSA